VSLFRKDKKKKQKQLKQNKKNMTNAAGLTRLSICKENVPINCVFVNKINQNTYSLLST